MEALREQSVTTDANGMEGRHCENPACGGWFKVRPETGVELEECACPYCAGELPAAGLGVRFLETVLEHLKLRTELEVTSHCDACGVTFAVIRPYDSCPHCKRQDAFRVFNASLEVSRRRLALLDSTADRNLQRAIANDALKSGAVALEVLVRKLATAKPELFPVDLPPHPIVTLDAAFREADSANIGIRIGAFERDELIRLVAATHVEERADAVNALLLLTRLGASIERDWPPSKRT